MMACDTERRAVDKNLSKSIVSYWNIFILAKFFMCLVLRCFFSTFIGVLTIYTIGVTKKYVLMGFNVLLLLTIDSNTGELSELYK